MKINFNILKQVEVSNMNNGVGLVKANMFIDESCKIIKSIIEPNGSMGKHTQMNNEFIYVISGQARIIIDGEEEIINKGEVHYCKLGQTHEIINNLDEDLVLLDITVEK